MKKGVAQSCRLFCPSTVPLLLLGGVVPFNLILGFELLKETNSFLIDERVLIGSISISAERSVPRVGVVISSKL